MSFTVVLHAVERLVAGEFSGAAADRVEAALRAVRPGGPTPVGQWEGPRARVTRAAELGAWRGWVTHVAWPYTFAVDDAVLARDPTLAAELARRLREEADAALATVSTSFEPSTVAPYAAAVNGPIEAWRDGRLSVTQTRDAFPTGAGRLDASENPVGETTAATHPSTPGDVNPLGPNGPVPRLASDLTVLGVAAAVVLALVYFGPALGNVAARATSRPSPTTPRTTTRANPRRRR